jgi:hypothetical protein
MRKEQQLMVVEEVTDYYLHKREFNGLPLATLRKTYSLTKRDLKILIENGDIEIHFGFGHPNPHIKALHLGDVEILLKTLAHVSTQELAYAVLYPTAKHLENTTKSSDYESRPFSLMLALGTPQLEPLAFDPQVLKTYRDDPRYIYDYSGVAGRISLADYDDDMPESERVIVETFGMGFSKNYDSDAKTCVIGLPYYLHKLTPEHQMLWKHRLLDMKKYSPEYGFVKSQIIGDWDFDTTMYEAFMAELKIINEMAVAIEGVFLFKKDTQTVQTRRATSIDCSCQRNGNIKSLQKPWINL